MTFLTKALGSRKRQQLYNFTITICHYDYRIMKLNCTMKLLVTLFSLFNMAIFGHFVSLWDTILRRSNLHHHSQQLWGPCLSAYPRSFQLSYLPWILTSLEQLPFPLSLLFLIATFTSLTSCLALECTSDSEFCGVVGYIEEITL